MVLRRCRTAQKRPSSRQRGSSITTWESCYGGKPVAACNAQWPACAAAQQSRADLVGAYPICRPSIISSAPARSAKAPSCSLHHHRATNTHSCMHPARNSMGKFCTALKSLTPPCQTGVCSLASGKLWKTTTTMTEKCLRLFLQRSIVCHSARRRARMRGIWAAQTTVRMLLV